MKEALLLLLSTLGIVAARNSYIATVPKSIRPGDELHVCIASLLGGNGNIGIVATLMDKDNKTVASTQGSHNLKGKVVVVKLQVPLSVTPGSGGYSLRVQSNGAINFNKLVVNIDVLSKSSSIFIQTDKATYKPGDLVQFRVFGTNSKLLVSDQPIDIWIEDPKNNRVEQFLQVTPSFGVFGGSFQLSTLTNFGGWTINVKQGTEESSKSFIVERYVLPKFDVNVNLKSFQLNSDEFFTGTVSAQYTFGKPVDGDVDLTIRGWSDNNAIKKTFQINGKADIKVLMSEITRIGSYIRVTASVTERITGISANATNSVTIYDSPEQLSFSPSMSSYFKPGLDYNIILRATNVDQSPLEPPLGEINITARYYVEKTQANSINSETQVMPVGGPSVSREEKLLWTRSVPIPTNGVISITAVFPKEASSGNIQAEYRKARAYQSVSKSHSPSDSFLQVTIVNDKKAVPGQDLPIKIQTTERKSIFNYKVFSKSVLVKQGRFRVRYSGQNPNLRITYDMAPNAKLLVYYARPNGEIVADAITFPVDDIFKNKVSLSFNKTRVQPGEEVELLVKADANSLVNLLAIDKSVMLLRTGNDITVMDVMNELQRYDNSGNFPMFRSWDFWMPRPATGLDAFSVFSQSGVYVLTDANLYQYIRPCQNPSNFRTQSFGMMAMADSAEAAPFGAGGGMGGGGNGGLQEPGEVRKDFRETWIWTNQTTDSSGQAKIVEVAPDTITEYITSAFAVNPTSGLGVSSEFANLTIFKRFFMRFELPFSAIRGEVIIVQATVFNYLDTDQEVSVNIADDTTFDFVDTNGSPVAPGPGVSTKTINVKQNSVGAAFFPIVPTKIGKIKLRGKAQTTQAADAVERDFLIEAEGVQQSYNVPLLIDLRQVNTFNEQVQISFPPGAVQDSEFIKVQVIGDLLGSTLNGIEDLLKMSYGCGEQNLVGFVPNVFVSNYLKATNRLTSELEQKSKKILSAGYQRQLSFARNDGSFSAFGENDKSGTTWLTSFVVKSFSQAADLTLIDINVITKAIRWLLKNQSPAGGFAEPGVVLHKQMQGGSVSSERSLTAFVLIALAEAKKFDQVAQEIQQDVDNAITQATNFVANGAPASISNLYELAISFYALSLVKHPLADSLLVELEKKATANGGEKFWVLPSTEAEIIQPWKTWNPPTTKVRALDVEMTSYILLGYNLKDDTANGIAVLKWLGKQRNPNGGFISTQDTVVALQALAGLGTKLYVPTFSLTVNVTATGWAGKSFSVSDSNALVLQSEDIPNNIRTVYIASSGQGLCFMEVVVYFNILEELRQPTFEVTPTVLNDSTKGFRLKVCFRWTRDGKSTMGLLEIGIPTGMEAELDSLDTSAALGQFKKVEPAFRRIDLYFDSILSSNMCVEVDVRRVSLVARHKPVPVRLVDYYEPSNEVIAQYQSRALADATIIEVCGAQNCEQVKRK